jgi:5-methyltetrahydrofolate--homocysteine methyltransferase
MGTMLQAQGLPHHLSPEAWMLSNPDKILDIHLAYKNAGARIIETNTFGANAIKLAEYHCVDQVQEINRLATKLARQAAGTTGFVVGLVGPTGQFPRPLGTVPFIELKKVFREQIAALADAGADMILLQTFSDIGEARAALLAAKETTNLPVGVSLTYSNNQRTLTGTDPQTAATIFAALGADVLGVNCSTGPEEMLPIIEQYRRNCRLPLLTEPNAGLPILENNQSVFPMAPADMAQYISMLLSLGVRWLGSCCGTTPEHTRAIVKAVATWEGQVMQAPEKLPSRLASRSKTVCLGYPLPTKIIGERINPTARKSLAVALQEGNYARLVQEGILQTQAGADLLDVNAGLAGGDEVNHLLRTTYQLQQAIELPLVIDSVKPEALEQALLHYQGKALINSVNAKEESMAEILPLAKHYGAAVLGLTLDQNGIPPKAENRLALAEKILQRALSLGISQENIFIDCLVMSAATDPTLARETLRAIRLVKEKLGLTTVLGISNISHGMPKRNWLNHTFLAQAIDAGLDAVIANPLDAGIRQTIAAGNLLAGRDSHGLRYIEQAQKEDQFNDQNVATVAKPASQSLGGSNYYHSNKTPINQLQQAIIAGNQAVIPQYITKLLDAKSFYELVQEAIIPALEISGDTFAKGETFLPQLLLAAEGARCAFDYLKRALPTEAPEQKETVILGAVAGDVHDIGKNIVKALLESYGYQIIDLGKNVPCQAFVEAAKKHDAAIVGLAALMTTTMTEMGPVITALQEAGIKAKVIVGGAVLTPEYAQSIQADAYVKDAGEAHHIIRSLLDS